MGNVRERRGDFPGCSVVKTSPSCSGGAGLIPGRQAKSPYASQLKHQNINDRGNTAANSMKTLKMVHSKRKSLKTKKEKEEIKRYIQRQSIQ